jgi:hypothetical protein
MHFALSVLAGDQARTSGAEPPTRRRDVFCVLVSPGHASPVLFFLDFLSVGVSSAELMGGTVVYEIEE